MLGKLYGWIVGYFCSHKWTTIDSFTVNDGYDNRWTRYILRCEKCGEITSRNPRGG